MLDRFADPLQSGEKAIELTKAAFAKLQKYYPNLRECNVKLKNVYTCKMLFLEVWHVETAIRLQNLEIVFIFSKVLIDFQFAPIFLVIFGKIF